MSNISIYKNTALRIPIGIRKKIIEEELIDKAINTPITGTPMEYLFDVYEEFIDTYGENDDWNCWRCREKVLSTFRIMKAWLI